MTAIIYDSKTWSTYVSPIFAINNKKTEVVVFNSDRSGVKRVNRWTNAYVLSADDFTCRSGKWRGYDWVVENEKLFRAMKYRKTASLEDFPEFRDYAEEIILPEWFEITDDASISVFMETAGIFHDAEVKSVEREGDTVTARIKSDFDCYFNMKFLEIDGDCNFEDHLAIDTAEIEFKDGNYYFLADNYNGKCSEIKCKKILWNLEIITKPYLRLHRNYPDISALCEDIIDEEPCARVEDGKMIVETELGVLSVESKNDGYAVYFNGKLEAESVEDQDIYDLLVDDYIYGVGEMPEVLWEFAHGRMFSLLCGLKHILFSAFFLSFCILLIATAESVGQVIIPAMFCSIAFLVFVMILIGVLQEKIEYKIYKGSVSISRIGEIDGYPFKTIDKVELKRSRIFKNRGTVIFTVGGKKHYLRFVIGADEAYGIIRERMDENNQP